MVTELNRAVVMDSSTFGVAVDAPGGYRADVEYAVRISDNGEFVHAAPWSVGLSQPGDAVEIRNSIGPTLDRADGDIYDWAVPWSTWQAASALH